MPRANSALGCPPAYASRAMSYRIHLEPFTTLRASDIYYTAARMPATLLTDVSVQRCRHVWSQEGWNNMIPQEAIVFVITATRSYLDPLNQIHWAVIKSSEPGSLMCQSQLSPIWQETDPVVVVGTSCLLFVVYHSNTIVYCFHTEFLGSLVWLLQCTGSV